MGFDARIKDAAEHAQIDWSTESTCLIVTSTYGDGDMPDNAQAWVDAHEGLEVSSLVKVSLKVVERIRMHSTCEYTPLIVMAASPARGEATVTIAYASGATDFVVVPVDPAILRAKVSAYVDLFAKTRALEQAVSHAKALNAEFRDSEVRTRAGT